MATMIEYVIYILFAIMTVVTSWLFMKMKPLQPYFEVRAKGGILVIIKTLSGERIMTIGDQHGNHVRTKKKGAYLLTGRHGELEKFHGVTCLFVNEGIGMVPEEQEKIALALLEAAVNDPDNSDIVETHTVQRKGILSKAVREELRYQYMAPEVDEDGNKIVDEDGQTQMTRKMVAYPTLASVLLTEHWANVLKKMVGVFQTPYEILEVIHITEMETIEKMKEDKGISELMKYVIAIVVILVTAALVFKMIGTGTGGNVVETVTRNI